MEPIFTYFYELLQTSELDFSRPTKFLMVTAETLSFNPSVRV